MKPPLPARASASNHIGWCLLKTLAQMIVFWAAFLAVFPWLVTRFEPPHYRFGAPGLRPAAVGLFAAASTLGVVSAVVMAVAGRGTPIPFDCPSRLVIAGPYRFVRNPMAIAGLAQGAAVGLYLGSPLVLGYVAAGFALWNWLIRPWEEDDLEQRFGDDFRRYRAAVRCWWPRLTPFRGPSPRVGKAIFTPPCPRRPGKPG